MKFRKVLCSLVGIIFSFNASLPIVAVGAGNTPQTPATTSAATPQRDEKLWKKALEIHARAIVVDTHNDILSFMTDDNYDIGVSSVGKYHTDIARMKQGGTNSRVLQRLYRSQLCARRRFCPARPRHDRLCLSRSGTLSQRFR